ncbi:MAG: hypothetical protein CMB56_005635 [Methanobacteriota archaeon]|nr:MAG: hypothetical protein CMB56_005635 [Euryarchaeota archaeon]
MDGTLRLRAFIIIGLMLISSSSQVAFADSEFTTMNSKESGDSGENEEDYDQTALPAIGISVTYDNITEISTISWYNIDGDGLDDQSENTALSQLSTASYLIFRHTSVITKSDLQTLSPLSSLTVSACEEETYFFCKNGTSPFHQGHSVDYQLSPEVSGNFYYAVVTQLQDGTLMDELYCGQNILCDSVNETTESVRTPTLLTATFNSQSETTTLSWVNYNQLNAGGLPDDGPDSLTIRVWRHSMPITRANGFVLPSAESSYLVASLTPSNNQIILDVPTNTQRLVYYSVTYYLPNYFGEGLHFEDIRFQSPNGDVNTNTLLNPILEDTSNPVTPVGVSAVFTPSQTTGTGVTNISWTDSLGEVGEEYTIWRSRLPITDVNEPGVLMIGTSLEGVKYFPNFIYRGTLGYYHYCITIEDANGRTNNTVSESNCATVFENTFDPWVAEPTGVSANYIGNALTKVTWIDQIGVEGEIYNIWRSNQPITNVTFISNPPELVGSVGAEISSYEVVVDDQWTQDSYYCVTTKARYNLEEFQIFEDREFDENEGTYEDFRFIQNCVGPITEDTTPPRKAILNSIDVWRVGDTAVRVNFQQIIEETGETYFIYRCTNLEIFEEGKSSLSSSEWELVKGPITFQNENEPSQMISIPIESGLNRDVWYAVAAMDTDGNLQFDLELDYNARLVSEDTLGPNLSVEILGLQGTSMKAGSYTIQAVLDETAGTNNPRISILDVDNNLLVNQVSMASTGGASNGFTYQFTLTETVPAGSLKISVTGFDEYGNSAEIEVNHFSADGLSPSLELYSPGSKSTESSYRYGDNIMISGGATDDVGIEYIQIRFTRNLRTENVIEETWQNLDVLIDEESEENSASFFVTYAAKNFEMGEHRLEIQAVDFAGNTDYKSIEFYVDRCEQLDTGELKCVFADSLEPEPEPEPVELEALAPPYMFTYVLAAFNIFAFIMIIATLFTAGRSPSSEDDDEGEDWMKEFIGTSAEPDLDSIMDTSVKSDPGEPNESKSLDEDDDDLFGESAPKPKNRREREVTSRKRRVRKSTLKNDDEDDEDDFGEKKIAPKRRKINRK